LDMADSLADSLAVAMLPAPFKCKKKGDQEPMLQDFSMYRRKIAGYLVASEVVIARTGAQTDSPHIDHAVCDSCKQEKAIMLVRRAVQNYFLTPTLTPKLTLLLCKPGAVHN
jgi:hypothetical protein